MVDQLDSQVTLSDIPDEVFGLIMEYLNQTHKLAMMFTNKQFYNKTIKYLYQSIFVQVQDYDLLVNTDICNSFNLKYTIINEIEKFLELLELRIHFLKYIKVVILSHNDEDEPYLEKLSQYDWIKVIREDGLETDLENITLSEASANLVEDNFTITQLNIWFRNLDDFDLKTLSHLKALDSVSYHQYSIDGLRDLASKVVQPLRVKRVLLFISPSAMLTKEEFPLLFKLDEISTLELVVNYDEGDEDFEFYLFNGFFRNFPNLKNFSYIRDYIVRMQDFFKGLKRNSLTSLILDTYWDDPDSRFKKALRNHEKSIQSFGLLHDVQHKCPASLERFDRIYKSYGGEDKFHKKMIIKALGKDTKCFPRLRHIMIKTCHYEVKRGRRKFRLKLIN